MANDADRAGRSLSTTILHVSGREDIYVIGETTSAKERTAARLPSVRRAESSRGLDSANTHQNPNGMRDPRLWLDKTQALRDPTCCCRLGSAGIARLVAR